MRPAEQITKLLREVLQVDPNQCLIEELSASNPGEGILRGDRLYDGVRVSTNHYLLGKQLNDHLDLTIDERGWVAAPWLTWTGYTEYERSSPTYVSILTFVDFDGRGVPV